VQHIQSFKKDQSNQSLGDQPTDPLGDDLGGCFDRAWYMKKYPDVAASGMDPLTHYLNHGTTELDFGHLGGIAGDVYQAVQGGAGHFEEVR
jgi:hypothetical protein